MFVQKVSRPKHTREIAQQVGEINNDLHKQRRTYLLIGFGRWGSSHPSLGIPVDWSQISGARCIVESTMPNMNVDFSQGSHFFHNLSSFGATYFMLRYDDRSRSIGNGCRSNRCKERQSSYGTSVQQSRYLFAWMGAVGGE